MSFNHNFIEELKNKLNIVDIIGQNIQLKKKGANYWGICPFHSEKTPSFSVNEEKQFYHCFGCGAGGDIIKFVQDYYKLDFNDAIAKICNDNGIELPKMTYQTNVNYKREYEINKIAATYYLNNLRKLPNPGYMYISKRGISNKTLNKFGIGYSNDSWDGLYRHMRALKIPEEELERIGLIKKNKNGKYYDKFRNRVIFPIINTQKKVYKEYSASFDKNQVIDASDLEMLPDNMSFNDNFVSYTVKGDGSDSIIRIVKKLESNAQTQTEKPKTEDNGTQTELSRYFSEKRTNALIIKMAIDENQSLFL